MARLSFRCDEELVKRVDEARKTSAGAVPREAWLRDAVEGALSIAEWDRRPAPAERPHRQANSSQAKRGVQERPKKGKRND